MRRHCCLETGDAHRVKSTGTGSAEGVDTPGKDGAALCVSGVCGVDGECGNIGPGDRRGAGCSHGAGVEAADAFRAAAAGRIAGCGASGTAGALRREHAEAHSGAA